MAIMSVGKTVKIKMVWTFVRKPQGKDKQQDFFKWRKFYENWIFLKQIHKKNSNNINYDFVI